MRKEDGKRMVELLTESYRRAREGRESGDVGFLALAELEDELWEKVKETEGVGVSKKAERRDWFHSKFGGGPSEYEIRATLFRGGKAAHVLFERMDNDTLSHSMAKHILARSRVLSKQFGVDLDKCVEEVLKQFKGTGPSVEKARLSKGAKAESAAKAVQETDTSFSAATDPTVLSKQFKATVMTTAQNYLDAMFAGRTISEARKSRMVDDFRISLDQLIDEWRTDLVVNKRKNKEETLQQISMEEFEWSCEVLGLKGTFGKSFDDRRLGRRYRERARGLHPDRNPTPEAREEYEAVVNAYEYLKKYNKVIGATDGRKKESK